jgi:CRISPR-associated protein Cmr4
MFEAATLLYLYVETPLHAGSGRGLGAVDLPVQRERITGYPLVQASSVKGKLRAEAGARLGEDDPQLLAAFGPQSGAGASDYAGAISPGDARLLLFPVRSLAGVFAWTTSVNVLARFLRDARAIKLDVPWTAPQAPDTGQALVARENDLTAGDKIVLEEFAFTPQERDKDKVKDITDWLVEKALPAGGEYAYWKEKLPRRLVILPEDDFRDFTLFATEVATRVRLDNQTKTVETGALWTEESLPTDTLLYAPLQATRARWYENGKPTTKVPKEWFESEGAQKVLKFVADLPIKRMQLGGDETVGRGMVCLRYGEASDV